MAGRPIGLICLSAHERRELERRTRSGVVARRDAERAQIILCRADGLSQEQTAQALGCSSVRVSKWVARFRRAGIHGLVDKPGRGRKPASNKRKDGEARSTGQVPATAKESDGGGIETTNAPFNKLNSTISNPPLGNGRSSATMRSVAAALGVSPMTVSRALHGRPGVSESVRRRVLRVAEAQGYVPDPEMGKLMTRLRVRRTRRLQGSICAVISADWTPGSDAYSVQVIAGARERARELGFAWDQVPLTEMTARPKRAIHVLQSRGTQGILLPPAARPLTQLPPREFWDDFSVIAATYSVVEPDFHRVISDQFRNMQTVCRALFARGCRRIGFAVRKGGEERVQYHSSGGYAAFHFEIDCDPLPIFSYTAGTPLLNARRWYEEQAPDAIVTASSWWAGQLSRELGLCIPGPVTFAALGQLDFAECPCGGIDELPGDVGARAVERLARMIIRNEKGVPQHPSVTMIEGCWHDGVGDSGSG